MNNITYNITECVKSDNRNKSNKNDTVWQEFSLIDEFNESEKCARTINYDLNYTVKFLTIILETYGIKKIN